jgi:SWI/SNF-related matrix-associated actin-dependent regulator of chromatin subfamily A protein 2/4
MQEKGLESDPRYSTLLSFARNAQQMQQMPGFPNDPNPMGNMMATQQAMSSEGFSNEEHLTMQANAGKNSGFSAEQINQLRSQIMAYKLLSHNQPLTEQIKMTLQSNSKGASSRLPNVLPSTTDRTGMFEFFQGSAIFFSYETNFFLGVVIMLCT